MLNQRNTISSSDTPPELQELLYPVKPFINPFIDVMFKKIFASETSKEVLRAFLNEVLKGKRDIKSITYGKNEYPGDIKQEAKAIFDVICTDHYGATFLVEVQSLEQSNLKERLLYYASRLISDQAPKGDKSWKYDIKEVYVIALMEKFCLPDKSLHLYPDQYLHDICLCDRFTGKIFYDKLNFICIEMTKFVKEKDELDIPLDEWLYALKHAPEMDEQPDYLNVPEIDHFFELARYSNFTEGERNMYRTAQQVRWDNENALDFAKDKAREIGQKEGHQEGHQEGHKEGHKEGHQEGLAEGIECERAKAKNEKREMAAVLKKKNVSIDIIAEVTGFTIQEVVEL